MGAGQKCKDILGSTVCLVGDGFTTKSKYISEILVEKGSINHTMVNIQMIYFIYYAGTYNPKVKGTIALSHPAKNSKIF